jgi:jumonji domain-containing protein 2
MDLPPNPVHLVCQMLHSFTIEALASRPEPSSLALDIEALCVRHPELESTIRDFYSAAQGFLHALSVAVSPQNGGASYDDRLEESSAIRNRDDVDTTNPVTATAGGCGDSSANEECPPGVVDSADLIPYSYDLDGILTLYPTTMDQCKDFPTLLKRATRLRANEMGVFKFKLPEDMGKFCQPSDNKYDRVSTFKPHVMENGTFHISREEGEGLIQIEHSPISDVPTEKLANRFESLLTNKSGLLGVRYCTDLEARSPEQRKKAGLPQSSPIWPAKGNQLDRTKFIVPGLHWPFAYISHREFGAPFHFHKEDCDLGSANLLYIGRKVWNTAAPKYAAIVEEKLKASSEHKYRCAQAVRHCARYFPRPSLSEIPIKVFSQFANEVVFVFKDTYHQGFSEGPTVAEAFNYAPDGWTIEGYSQCLRTCPGFPIPNALMEFRASHEKQIEDKQEADERSGREKRTSKKRTGKKRTSKKQTREVDEPEADEPEADELEADGPGADGPAADGQDATDDAVASRKRRRGVPLAVEFPSKKRTFEQKTREETVSQTYWKDWDRKRTVEHGIDQPIKAEQVFERLSSTAPTSRAGQQLSQPRFDFIVAMVMAVANTYAFQALREVITFLQQNQASWTLEIFSTDPKILVRAVDAIETSSNLNCYLRRLALARLAALYWKTCANGGTLCEDDTLSSSRSAVKKHKAAAYNSLIQHIWGFPFPERHKGAKMTKKGLIDATTHEARLWNEYKSKLLNRLEVGHRWLNLADRFGWPTLVLIARNWSIKESRVSTTDTT